MAFTPEQVEEFIATLQQDAALRDRVRNAILADDFLALPGLVRENGEQIGRLTERMEQLTQEVRDLRLDLQSLSTEVAKLARLMSRLTGRVENLDGRMYEFDFERKLSARIGPRFRAGRALGIYDISALTAAMDAGRVTREEVEDAARLDIVAEARDADEKPAADVVLAIEVSVTVDPADVMRAARRAAVLEKCGLAARPVVAGDRITREALEAAAGMGVVTLIRKPAPDEEPGPSGD
jgi:hypothetical protein